MITANDYRRKEPVPTTDVFRALARDFATRLRAGDTAGLAFAFYAEGARMVPADSCPVNGREPIQRYWQSMVEEGVCEASFEATGVECAPADAYVIGRYAFETRPPASPFSETGISFVLFRRQRDGSWKAVEQTFHRD